MVVQPQRKHYDAFNYWFNLTQKGYSTTEAIELTADWVGIGVRRMWIWYKDLDWKGKSQQRMRDIQKEYEKKENRTLAKNKKKYLDICHKLLYDYVENGLPTEVESVKDLETLIKTCLILQDAPSKVVKQDQDVNVEVADNSNLFDKDLMAKIIEQEKDNL